MKEKFKKEEHDQDKQEETGEHESPTLDAGEDEEDGQETVIKPIEKSIGEGRDNLRQREGWFRRRTGIRS